MTFRIVMVCDRCGKGVKPGNGFDVEIFDNDADGIFEQGNFCGLSCLAAWTTQLAKPWPKKKK